MQLSSRYCPAAQKSCQQLDSSAADLVMSWNPLKTLIKRTVAVERVSPYAKTPYARFLYVETAFHQLEQHLAEATVAFHQRNGIQLKQHILELKISAIGCRRAFVDFGDTKQYTALIDASEKIINTFLLLEYGKATITELWAVCQDELARCAAALHYITEDISLVNAKRDWVKKPPPHPIRQRYST